MYVSLLNEILYIPRPARNVVFLRGDAGIRCVQETETCRQMKK